jgi:hypothetical protein
MSPAADRVTQCSENPEDQTDDEDQDPQRPENGDAREKANDEQHDAEHDHGASNDADSLATFLNQSNRVVKDNIDQQV